MSEKLTLQQVATYPRPGMAGPKKLNFTPDSRYLVYLWNQDGGLALQPWLYDLPTGRRRMLEFEDTPAEPDIEISREEELRRERSRTRETGLTGYRLAGGRDGQPVVMLAPLGGWLYLLRDFEGKFTRLEGSQGAVDPRLSPDGRRVAFVREGELRVMDLASGALRTLTSGADEAASLTNGLAEYIAQEEMGRAEGYWWSYDSSRLAYVQADSRHLPLYPIVHQGKDGPLDVEEHRYPFAGGPNSRVRLGVVEAVGGPTRWLDLGPDEDIYLARVNWRPDGRLTAQVETRDHRKLRLLIFDPDSGAATTLIEEGGQPWLNLNDHLRYLKSGEMVWGSEKSGFLHLYRHDRTGREIQALTSGEWLVTNVLGVDEEQRLVYFQATRESPLERHIYRVSLDGGEPQQLSREAGWHEAVMAEDCRWMVLRHSSLEQPEKVALYRLDAQHGPQWVSEIYSQPEVNPAALNLRPPELASFTTRDGQATLYAAIYQPDRREPGRRYPLIVSVYGGPHAQRVTSQWDLTVDLRAQYLARQGFVVLKVDNRGSANRGLDFEGALAWNMGDIEVRDQVDGVNFMAGLDYVDPDRVGIYGWSYGGYMSLMALLRAPEIFKVGVAGAPVTHWDGYDTFYTEHYMGRPDENPKGYRNSSVMAHIKHLRGKLMLMHGMVDENVHFRHTARLLRALNAAQKEYDILIFPEERHMPRDPQGLEYQERRLVEYFKRHL